MARAVQLAFADLGERLADLDERLQAAVDGLLELDEAVGLGGRQVGRCLRRRRTLTLMRVIELERRTTSPLVIGTDLAQHCGGRLPPPLGS